MRRATPLRLAPAALAAAALLAGCGSQGTIPPDRADAIQQHLDDARAAVTSGDCGAAASRVQRVRSDVENLAGIPTRLRRNLLDGVDKLRTAAATDCQDAQQETQTQTQTQPQTTETTPTVDTTTTPTTTTPTTPTTTPPPTTTTPPTTTPPPTDTAPTGGVPPGQGGDGTQDGDGQGGFGP
jgi:hypothetical protein